MNCTNKEELTQLINDAAKDMSIKDIRDVCFEVCTKLDSKIDPKKEKIVHLSNAVIENSLRYIALGVENGSFQEADSCTLVYGQEVFHNSNLKITDEQAAIEAVFNLELGKTKLINAGLGLII